MKIWVKMTAMIISNLKIVVMKITTIIAITARSETAKCSRIGSERKILWDFKFKMLEVNNLRKLSMCSTLLMRARTPNLKHNSISKSTWTPLILRHWIARMQITQMKTAFIRTSRQITLILINLSNKWIKIPSTKFQTFYKEKDSMARNKLQLGFQDIANRKFLAERLTNKNRRKHLINLILTANTMKTICQNLRWQMRT